MTYRPRRARSPTGAVHVRAAKQPAVALGAATVALVAGLLVPPPPPAAAGDPTLRTQNFDTPCATTTFVVPPRTKVVAFNLLGASGGGSGIQPGAFGGRLSGLLLTQPGETLTVTAGGRGGPGQVGGAGGAGGCNGGGAGGADSDADGFDWNGAGGGGATTIRRAGVLIAAAGGGAGGTNVLTDVATGGSGGGFVGGDGFLSEDRCAGIGPADAGGCGGGATVGPRTGGGAGGYHTSGDGRPGGNGTLLNGGNGGAEGTGAQFGGGGDGGGGGWFGGGGGAGSGGGQTSNGGGGGGSSWGDPARGAVGITAERGVNPLAGRAIFSWLEDGGPVPVTVQVTPAQAKSPGQSVTVTATVKDQDGNGMAGRTVTWDRRGVNPGTSTAFTDAAGNASLSYAGIGGGGADVVTASTPSLAGVTVSGVGSVVWTGAPSATAVEFVPPGVHAPSGSATLSFRATKADGSPFSGSVLYAVGPLGNPGAFTGTATATGGQGTIPVTTAASEVEVAAFADRPSPGSFGDPEPVESLGVAVVTTRPVPTKPMVALDPPVATGSAGSGVPLTVKATWTDGTPYSGPVGWCSTAVWDADRNHLTCPSSGHGIEERGTVEATDGVATITVRAPSSSVLAVRVMAWADGNRDGVHGPTEATGVATVVGVNPPNPAEVTTVAFTPPAAQRQQGSPATLSFRALRGNGSPFTGRVRWGMAGPGSVPTFSYSEASAGSDGTGRLTVPSGSASVLQVFAHADSSSGGVPYSQDATEVAAVAVVVGTPTPPGTRIAFVPPVAQGPAGSPVRLDFTAARNDGSAFSGTVRYSFRPPGELPAFDGSATATGGQGTLWVTPTADSQAFQVLGFADAAGNGLDAGELLAAAAVVNSTPPPPPSPGTELVFTTPVTNAPEGVTTFAAFKALRHDGSPFVGTVRWGYGPVGSSPPTTNAIELTAQDNGSASVPVPAGATPTQVFAYADRGDDGRVGTRDETEVLGTEIVVGAG